MMEKAKSLGKRISQSRQNRNMSQEEMANRIGVTPQAVSKWERGQSLPDVALLADICYVLGVSADYLLETHNMNMTENGDTAEQEIVLNNLRHCLEPLELLIGSNLVPLFVDNSFVDQIRNIRRGFSEQGILVPIVRVKDSQTVRNNEFKVLSFQKVLYEEEIDEISDESLAHIMMMLSEAIRSNYAYILNPDLVKKIVDNLQSEYPAMINGVVPEKISYGLLTDVLRKIMLKGNAMLYLIKIIEYMESVLREEPDIDSDKLAKIVLERIEVGR